MRKKNLSILCAISFLLISGRLCADEVRYQFDENFPSGLISRADFNATLRGLHQMDFAPLRPSAKRVLDGMEYTTDAAAQAAYSGTGVTITSDNANETEGAYSLKAVIDGTGNRSFERSLTINLSAYEKIYVWERSSQSSDTLQFYIEDGSANESYYDLTTSGTADTWQQDALTLDSPDSNNGSDADLSDVVAYGYRQLTASKTYYFDTIKTSSGMTVSIKGSDFGDYWRQVTFGGQPLRIDGKSAPTLTAPTTNPRIDILTLESDGDLVWVAGTEAASPSAPWSDVPNNVIPICEVYLKTTMTEILNYEDKDTDTNQGYILSDVRPFISLGSAPEKGGDVASASSIDLGTGTLFDITGSTNISSITAKPAGTFVVLQFDGALTVSDGSNLKLNGDFETAAESVITLISDGSNWYEASRQPTAGDFVSLSDTPSSYSSQSKKYLRVNSGETAVEFISDPFDTTSGHDHDGTDAKKIVVTNIDPTGVTDGHFLKRSGSAVAGQSISQNTDSAFMVYLSIDQTVNGLAYDKIAFNTESFDSGADYDASTNYRFTAPQAGKYFFAVKINMLFNNNYDAGTASEITLKKNGVLDQVLFRFGGNTSSISWADTPITLSGSIILDLAQSDYIEVFLDNNDSHSAHFISIEGTAGESTFSGFLLSD